MRGRVISAGIDQKSPERKFDVGHPRSHRAIARLHYARAPQAGEIAPRPPCHVMSVLQQRRLATWVQARAKLESCLQTAEARVCGNIDEVKVGTKLLVSDAVLRLPKQ